MLLGGESFFIYICIMEIFLINSLCMYFIGIKYMVYWMLYFFFRNRDRGEGEMLLYKFYIMDGIIVMVI